MLDIFPDNPEVNNLRSKTVTIFREKLNLDIPFYKSVTNEINSYNINKVCDEWEWLSLKGMETKHLLTLLTSIRVNPEELDNLRYKFSQHEGNSFKVSFNLTEGTFAVRDVYDDQIDFSSVKAVHNIDNNTVTKLSNKQEDYSNVRYTWKNDELSSSCCSIRIECRSP